VAGHDLEGLTAVAPTDLNRAAEKYLASGRCVLPALRAEKRPAVRGRWEPYKTRLPTAAELRAWFANAQDGLCLVCGAVSGNLEMIDFDFAGELFEPWKARVESASPGLLDRLAVEATPSSGRHAAYRCEADVCGNLKLAQRRRPVADDEVRLDAAGREVVILGGKEYAIRTDAGCRRHVILTLIETRGEGGLFLCDPTEGYDLIQGDLCDLPVLTADERDILLQAAWELNEYVPPVVNGPRPTPGGNGAPLSAPCSNISPPAAQPAKNSPIAAHNADRGPVSADSPHRPGDDFNARGDVRDVLQQHGWSLARAGENEYWRRPGKASGWSATLKDRVFYVFSSNAAPFEHDRAYSPLAVYNTYEDINDGSGTEGNGVDLADLKDPEYLPVPVGTPVWLREAITGAGGTEMLFHFTNEVLGDDNRSSSSSSSSCP